MRGYARWFAVDLICALTELRMLGVAVDVEYEKQVRLTIAARAEGRARWRARSLVEETRPKEYEWPLDWPIEWIPVDAADDCATDDANPF